jgi:puromycin-sensitive aminopeptidase
MDDYRLPDTVRPIHYTLTLQPNLDAGTYTGKVSIELEVRQATDTVVLNAVDMEIAGTVTMDAKRERATVKLPKPLQPGKATIDLEFKAKLSDSMRGFYKSSYTTLEGAKRTMATTQFESASARRAFPCFDEPALKATFDVTLVVPKDRMAISNTEIVKEETLPGNLRAVHFARTPVMSTYLLAFIVGEFDVVQSKTKDGTPVRVFTAPGRTALGEFALETAVRGLEFFGDYYAIPYREAIGKADLIAIPDFEAGAMENWGAITFREVALYMDKEKSSIPIRRRVAEVVLHELAHQWFGNLVTMKWWNELWLNESFATFMAYKAADALFPEWKVWDEYVSGITSGGKSLDSLRSSHPVEVPVKDPGEVDQIFDAISYNKGGSLLRMLEATIGAEAFRDGIRRYLKRHRYANASTRDLWDALSEGSKWDVAAMMAGWTGQTGFPVVLAGRKGDSIKLRQERFLLDRDPEKPADDPTLWTIPITPAVKLDKREAEVRANVTKLNAGQTGFYLVHYDSEWRRSLKPMSLPEVDRYGLVEDATSLMRAGYLSVGEFLDLAAAFSTEESYHVWAQIAGGVGMLADIFVGDPAVPKMEAWAQKLFRPIVDKVGWDLRSGEPHDRVLLRSVVLGAAVRFGDSTAVEEAKRRLASAKKPETISADIRGVVFGAAARHGDDAAYKRLVELYETSELPETKVQLLGALGGFRQDAILRRAFAYSLSDKVRPQDAMYVVGGTPIETRRTAWALLKENWQTLDERYGKSGMIARFIQAAASGIPEEEHARDVEAFFKDHPAPFATERIKQTLEGIRARAKFRRRNASALSQRAW